MGTYRFNQETPPEGGLLQRDLDGAVQGLDVRRRCSEPLARGIYPQGSLNQ